MTLYDENGFLGAKLDDWIVQHRESHRAILTLALELNRECHRFIDGRSVDLSDTNQLTNAALFARLMELYQSVLLTVDRGMRAPTRILFRAFLECFFHFAAIHNDPEYLEVYLDQVEVQRKKLVNRIRRTTDPGLENLRQPIGPELIQEIGDIDVSGISIAEVATRAGWHSVYVTVYELLSRSVHSNAGDIEAHLECDRAGREIISLRYGPTDAETARTIGLAGMTMADALNDIARDFSEDLSEQCTKLKRSFESLLMDAGASKTS